MGVKQPYIFTESDYPHQVMLSLCFFNSFLHIFSIPEVHGCAIKITKEWNFSRVMSGYCCRDLTNQGALKHDFFKT